MRLFLSTRRAGIDCHRVAACQPAPPAATTSTAATQDAVGNTIPTQAGIRCDQGMCTVAAGTNSPRFNVELAKGCRDDGLFAQVYQPGGAALHAQLPVRADSTAHAQLADKQFVCVLATASTQATAAYHYVRTQDPGQLASCARVDACPAPLPGPERSGWVDATALDVFSNGLDLSRLDDAALAPASNADWATRQSVRSGDGQYELQVLEDRHDGQRPRPVRMLQTSSDGTTREIASNDRLCPAPPAAALPATPAPTVALTTTAC